MKNKALILFLLMIACGCTAAMKPADVINKDYQSVNFQDGVTQEEAFIIAKKEVMDQTPPQTYIIQEPKVMTDFESVPYQDQYWFVSFNEVEKGSTPIVYMVAIRKDTGKIVFSRSYSPLNEWLIEAALLKLHEKPE